MAADRERVLIVTSSGGGAHLVAAEALAARLRRDPAVELVGTVDLLLEWAGPLGRIGVRVWNGAMRRGNTRRMTWALRLQWLGDVVFHPLVLRNALRVLRRLRVDTIYDAQVMGTRAMLLAARRIRAEEGRGVRIVKVLTEPANDALGQYFDPIRRLPDGLRAELRVWGSPPLLARGETAPAFWRRTCGLSRSQVDEGRGFPVRDPFLRDDDATAVRDPSSGEPIPDDARIVTVLMGSQGTWRFTRETVRGILARFDDPDLYVFVYAREDAQRRELASLAADSGSRTRIVALPYFDAARLAALYRRSDATVTRSGGMTSMELLAVGRAPALVCAESGADDPTRGMIRHELGNFRYLERFHRPGAWIVRPAEVAGRLAAIFAERPEPARLAGVR